jgi:hypothetical protein
MSTAAIITMTTVASVRPSDEPARGAPDTGLPQDPQNPAPAASWVPHDWQTDALVITTSPSYPPSVTADLSRVRRAYPQQISAIVENARSLPAATGLG